MKPWVPPVLCGWDPFWLENSPKHGRFIPIVSMSYRHTDEDFLYQQLLYFNSEVGFTNYLILRRIIMSTMKNLKVTTRNSLNTISGVVAFSSQILADASGMVLDTPDTVTEIVKGLWGLRKTVPTGYISEDRNISEAKASKIVDDFYSVSLRERVDTLGILSGRKLASLKELLEEE